MSFKTHHLNGGIHLLKMPLLKCQLSQIHNVQLHYTTAALVDQSHVTLNQSMAALTGYVQSQRNGYDFDDTDKKGVKYRSYLTEVFLYCLVT